MVDLEAVQKAVDKVWKGLHMQYKESGGITTVFLAEDPEMVKGYIAGYVTHPDAETDKTANAMAMLAAAFKRNYQTYVVEPSRLNAKDFAQVEEGIKHLHPDNIKELAAFREAYPRT